MTNQNQNPVDVSTHSRTKAAAINGINFYQFFGVSTHSRTKAAAEKRLQATRTGVVSTHSRTKAAAPYLKKQEKSAY